MKIRKIRIIGSSGSGKSFIAKKLSKELKINSYDLDDIFWFKKYTKRRSNPEISKRISKILRKKQWIIEGIQYYDHNIEKTFKDAEVIIWANPGIMTTLYRLIKRFVNRLSKESKTQKVGLKLIMHATKYKLKLNSKSRNAHEGYCKIYQKKAIIFKNKKDIEDFIKK